MVSKIKSLAYKLSGVIDVASVSAANLLISIFILRELSSSNYAIYVNLFSVLMLFSTLQNAFFNTALSVHCAKIIDSNDKKTTAFHTCVLANIVYILLLIPVFLFSLKYSIWFVLSVYGAHVLYLNRELFRIYNFLFGQKGFVIIASFCYLFVLCFCLSAGFLLKIDSLVYIYILLFISLLFALCILLSGVSMQKIKLSGLKDSFETIRGFAKWTSIGSLATWAQNNSYTYLTTIIIGLEATAALAASRLLIMPINLVASGIYMAEKPRWSMLFNANRKKLMLVSRKISFSMFFFVFCYGSFVLYFSGYFSELMRINIDGELLLFWLVATGIQCFKFSNSNILSVKEDFKYLAVVGSITALIGVLISLVVGLVNGALGILIGYCIGELAHYICTSHRIKYKKVFYAN